MKKRFRWTLLLLLAAACLTGTTFAVEDVSTLPVINDHTITMYVGETRTYTCPQTDPTSSTLASVTPGVVQTSKASHTQFSVTALAVGETVVTFRSAGLFPNPNTGALQVYDAYYYTLNITVKPELKYFELTNPSLQLHLDEENTKIIGVHVSEDYDGGFTYFSSDESIASVDRNGAVTGHRPGICTIHVGAGGKERQCIVEVGYKYVPGRITLSQYDLGTLRAGAASVTLTVDCDVDRAETAPSSVWQSSDPTTASVDPRTGVVTFLDVGEADITFFAGGVTSAACHVNVLTADGADYRFTFANENGGSDYTTCTGIRGRVPRDVAIPGENGGFAVTSVGAEAFSGYGDTPNPTLVNMQTLTVPESVTEIGANAFSGCSDLRTLTIQGGPAIRRSAFADCPALAEADLGRATCIGDEAFLGCESLRSLTIPETVTSMGLACLNGCTALTDLTIPFVGRDVTYDGNYAEAYLFGHIFGYYLESGSYPAAWHIPEPLTVQYTDPSSHRDYFYCIPTSLRRVTVTGDADIPDYAFHQCAMLERITLTGAPAKAGTKAFAYSSIHHVVLPDSMAVLGGSAFYSCKNLESLVLPRGLTNIGDQALYACTALKFLVIPDQDLGIGKDIFAGPLTFLLSEYQLQYLGLPRTLEASKSKFFPSEQPPSLTGGVTLTTGAGTASGIVLHTQTLRMSRGEVYHLAAYIRPAAAGTKALTWSSSDDSVAAVDSHGRITALGQGTAVITAAVDGVSAACTVLVAPVIETFRLEGEAVLLTFSSDAGARDRQLRILAAAYDQAGRMIAAQSFAATGEDSQRFHLTISGHHYKAFALDSRNRPVAAPAEG